MQWHELKTNADSFEAIRAGTKRADLRVNDRDYQVGDVLALHKLLPGGGALGDDYVPQPDLDCEPMLVRVTHMQTGYGLDSDHVMLSLERVRLTVTHG